LFVTKTGERAIQLVQLARGCRIGGSDEGTVNLSRSG
jgi:hypothetical protein